MRSPLLAFALASLSLSVATACSSGSGFGGLGGGGGDPEGGKAPPAPRACDLGCPSGYTCNDGVCEGGDPRALTFDVRTFAIGGHVTANGAAPGVAECDGDQIAVELLQGPAKKSFLDPIRGSMIRAGIACASASGAFSTRAPAGTYRVVARRYDSRSSFPDAAFLVDPAFQVTAAQSSLAWNVSTVRVAGKIAAEGRAPGIADCDGTQVNIMFVDERGASFDADVPCNTADGSFSGAVAPGTYRVLARRYNSRSSFPDATFLVDPAFEVKSAVTSLAWNVSTVRVSGKITADGTAPGVADCEGAQVSLAFVDERGASFDAEVACSASDGSFSGAVAPGTYRVLARRYNSRSSFPDATFLVNPAFEVKSAATSLAWNVSTVRVAGKLTADGNAPGVADCEGAQVKIAFVDERGASFDAEVACGTSDGSFSGAVAPGTYRVLARRYDSRSSFPDATFLVNPAFEVKSAATSLAWDVSTLRVAGTIAVDGKAPPAAECEDAQVKLTFLNDEGARFDADVPCGASTGAFGAAIAPGVYQVLARRHSSSSAFPDATFGLVDRIAIK